MTCWPSPPQYFSAWLWGLQIICKILKYAVHSYNKIVIIVIHWTSMSYVLVSVIIVICEDPTVKILWSIISFLQIFGKVKSVFNESLGELLGMLVLELRAKDVSIFFSFFSYPPPFPCIPLCLQQSPPIITRIPFVLQRCGYFLIKMETQTWGRTRAGITG